MQRAIALAIVIAAAAVALVLALQRQGGDEGARCGVGFQAEGARCLPLEIGDVCPVPLVATPAGCDAPELRVLVPGASLVMGPSDWEAEGRVPARSIHVQPFRLDAFEATRGLLARVLGGRAGARSDTARAANEVSPAEAMAACAAREGRLPTEDEWIVAAAAAANPPRRYPWGDTGAVCRRAAWGLDAGPCAHGADGPDTVGAHADGDSPLGLHDLAGNVAEWVVTPALPAAPARGTWVAKGGDWTTSLATDLRVWARLELPAGAERATGGDGLPRDRRVGFRCAYPP